MKPLFSIFFVLALLGCTQEQPESNVKKIISHEPVVKTKVKEVNSVIYTANSLPVKMTVHEKKKRFRYLLVPAVKRIFNDLDKQYKHIKAAMKSGTDNKLISRLKIEYKAKTDNDLLEKLKPHPVSIVLAQAALESAWGTSRFFIEAKNIFGVWSFNKNEPRIAAGGKRGNKTIWLKKYKTIDAAIRDNYRVLARGAAFDKFRKLRFKSNNPFELVKGLDKYSELGSKYGAELASVIRFNKFNKFNQFDL